MNGSKSEHGYHPSFNMDQNSMMLNQSSKLGNRHSPNNLTQGNNAVLMSPSVNQSSRAGFMNDTRISMQSSLIKTGDVDGNSRIINQSIGGHQSILGSRNQFNVHQQQISKARISSMNSSLDFSKNNHTVTDMP